MKGLKRLAKTSLRDWRACCCAPVSQRSLRQAFESLHLPAPRSGLDDCLLPSRSEANGCARAPETSKTTPIQSDFALRPAEDPAHSGSAPLGERLAGLAVLHRMH